jgi:cyclopropane fatty-acyl-phospholipid synthase-like methyltransferase
MNMQTDPELERWNNRFAGEEYVFGTEPNAFLASQAALLRPGMRGLSIADGEGRNGVWLARQGLAVTSVDFSPAAQAKARRLAESHGVSMEFVLADLDAWDWGRERFDLVVGIFFQFAEAAKRVRMFRHMQDTLAPGGLLMIEGYTPAQLKYRTGGPSELDHLYTEALLRDAFADMEILHLAEYEAELNEGHRHRGMSGVIDLVARKRM